MVARRLRKGKPCDLSQEPTPLPSTIIRPLIIHPEQKERRERKTRNFRERIEIIIIKNCTIIKCKNNYNYNNKIKLII